MGKRTTTTEPSSLGALKWAKTGTSSSPATNAPSKRAQAARGNCSPPPHVINKYEFHVNNSKHIARYDSVASGRIIELKYMNVDLLKNLGLWDSLNELLEVARWTKFMSLALPVCERHY